MRSWLLQSGLQIVADMENHKRGYLGVAYAHLCFNLAGMLSDFGLHDRALAFNHKALAARVSLSVQIRTTHSRRHHDCQEPLLTRYNSGWLPNMFVAVTNQIAWFLLHHIHNCRLCSCRC